MIGVVAVCVPMSEQCSCAVRVPGGLGWGWKGRNPRGESVAEGRCDNGIVDGDVAVENLIQGS